jgi:hypothetical protein
MLECRCDSTSLYHQMYRVPKCVDEVSLPLPTDAPTAAPTLPTAAPTLPTDGAPEVNSSATGALSVVAVVLCGVASVIGLCNLRIM